jgi:hypothetical protein
MQLLDARGVNCMAYTRAKRVPAEAGMAFPEMTKRSLVDIVIGKDNEKWLLQHMCDSRSFILPTL